MPSWKTFIALCGRFVLLLSKMRRLGETIKRPTSTTEYKPEELLKPNTSVKARFDMLMSEIALIQERISHMAISLAALTEQVERVASTQTMAVEKINKLVADMEIITADLAAKAAAAENAVDANELNALVEKLKVSTDSLITAVERK